MGTLGPRAAVDRVFPVGGMDAERIFSFMSRNGATGPDIIAKAAARIGAVNEQLIAQYGGILTVTMKPFARYGQGDGTTQSTPLSAEFKSPEGVRAPTPSGHMLPLRDMKDASNWTPEYLRDAYDTDIDDDIKTVGDRWKNRVAKDLWTRALTNTENAIGTSGYDVGWAIGTGTNVNFIPPQYGTYVFDSTHTHYIAQSGAVNATNAALVLEAGSNALRHHGHIGRLVAMVSDADIAVYQAISADKFVKVQPGMFTVVAGNSAAPVNITNGELQGIPGEVIGYFIGTRGVTEIRTDVRIPSGYAFMTKSYGIQDSRNGLVLREHPEIGFGLYPDPILTKSINPQLDYIEYKALFGVGVNDRTNGVAIYIGGPSYTNPTISG